MIDRIQSIITEIELGMPKDNKPFTGIFLSRDEWLFVHKCLSNYQAHLIKEVIKDE